MVLDFCWVVDLVGGGFCFGHGWSVILVFCGFMMLLAVIFLFEDARLEGSLLWLGKVARVFQVGPLVVSCF